MEYKKGDKIKLKVDDKRIISNYSTEREDWTGPCERLGNQHVPNIY